MRLTPVRGTKNTFRGSCEKGRLIAFSLSTQVCAVGKTVEKKSNSRYFLDTSLCASVKLSDCECYKFPAWCILVSFNGRPAPLHDYEIDSLRNGIANGICPEPHPYLKVGRRVRVKYGPLAGIEGFLVRRKDKFRVVISIDLIMRSIAAEVQVADLE